MSTFLENIVAKIFKKNICSGFGRLKLLTILENISANISENHIVGISENKIDECIGNIVGLFKSIRWHILSRREAHYS